MPIVMHVVDDDPSFLATAEAVGAPYHLRGCFAVESKDQASPIPIDNTTHETQNCCRTRIYKFSFLREPSVDYFLSAPERDRNKTTAASEASSVMTIPTKNGNNIISLRLLF